MYGLIFKTLYSLVTKISSGDDALWKQICAKAEITDVEFLSHKYYEESYLGRFIQAACDVLDMEQDAVMQAFGEHFFEFTQESGHSQMLNILGSNLFGFLINLDSLHSHLSYTFIEMQAPSFQCTKTDEGLELHYYSKREGLYPIVIGIVQKAAKEFFHLDVNVVMKFSEKLEGVALCNHYVFDITLKNPTLDDLELLQGEQADQPSIFSSQFIHLSPVSNRASGVMLDGESVDDLTEDDPQPDTQPVAANDQTSCKDPIPIVKDLSIKDVNPSIRDLNPPIREYHSPVMLRRPRRVSTGNLPSCPMRMSYGGEKLDLPDPHMPLKEKMRDSLTIQEDRPYTPTTLPLKHLPTHLQHVSLTPGQSRRGSIFFATDDWPISPSLFRSCFPFHIIFDSNLVIKYMGMSLFRLFPRAISSQAKLTEYFTIQRPAIPATTYQHIKSRAHNEFILQTRKIATPASLVASGKSLQFKGQMVPSQTGHIVFLGSPRAHSIDELQIQGLYLSDIPIHDVTRDLILLNKQLQAEINIAMQLDIMRKRLEEEKERVQYERARAEELLHAMLPEPVAKKLTEGSGVQATYHDEVTILFSDIKDFTRICTACHPQQVVTMLNDLYTHFDEYVDECGVYKVETIGDAYMITAGILNTAEEHAYAVTKFAFKMREVAKHICRPTDNQPLEIRIGIHTGSVMAGVVGTRMPRYCLFGDTVNMASRMESHGLPNKIHISDSTFLKLYGKPVKYECRGRIQVKGKDILQLTFFVDPLGPNEEPDLRYFQKERDEMMRDHQRQEYNDISKNIPRQEESYISMDRINMNKLKTLSTSTSENSVGLGVTNPSNLALPPISSRGSARPRRGSGDSGGIVMADSIFSTISSNANVKPPMSRNNRQIMPQASSLPNQVIDDNITDGSSRAIRTDDDIEEVPITRKSRRRIKKCIIQ